MFLQAPIAGLSRPATARKSSIAWRRPAPTWFLLDLEMPVKGGFATLVEIRKHPRFSRVPVMAVTAKAMLLDHDRILAAGFDAYVTKPIDMRSYENAWMSYWAHPEKENA